MGKPKTDSDLALEMITPKFEKLLLSDLQVDTSYQRDLKPHWKTIVKKFEASLVGIPIVAKRGLPGYAPSLQIIDGQQRTQALKSLGYTHWVYQVIRSQGETIDEQIKYEAHIFSQLNTLRKPLNWQEKMKAYLASEDPIAVEVQNICNRHGVELGLILNKPWPHIYCLSALFTIVSKQHSLFLDQALKTTMQAWPGNKHALKDPIIRGLTTLYEFYKEQMTVPAIDQFIIKLQEAATWKRNPINPLILTQNVRARTGTKQAGDVACELFIEIWNKGRNTRYRDYLDMTAFLDRKQRKKIRSKK